MREKSPIKKYFNTAPITYQVYKSIHFCKGYITGVLNIQTILMLYRVCANYTVCNMKKKKLFSLFDTYPGYSKQSHV